MRRKTTKHPGFMLPIEWRHNLTAIWHTLSANISCPNAIGIQLHRNCCLPGYHSSSLGYKIEQLPRKCGTSGCNKLAPGCNCEQLLHNGNTPGIPGYPSIFRWGLLRNTKIDNDLTKFSTTNCKIEMGNTFAKSFIAKFIRLVFKFIIPPDDQGCVKTIGNTTNNRSPNKRQLIENQGQCN